MPAAKSNVEPAPSRIEPRLFLVPSMGQLSREELENFLSSVRARRLEAAVIYQETRNAKLSRQAEIHRRKINSKADLLEKDLARLDTLVEKIEKRLEEIQIMEHNLEQTEDMIVVIDKSADEE